MSTAATRQILRSQRQNTRLTAAERAGADVKNWEQKPNLKGYVIFGTPFMGLPAKPLNNEHY